MANDSKRVLVTGKNGQLGSSIAQLSALYPALKFTYVDREELDLSSADAIRSFFSENTYDVVVNCAAYTAVDRAEEESGLADKINHHAVGTIAEEVKKQDAVLIHVSTDYVFDGQAYKPYQESDSTSPQSVYGDTKLQGELAFLNVNPKGCIVRTSWVYSEFGNNFVKTMQRLGRERDSLGVIYDQVGSPTYAEDLARVLLDIVCSNKLESLENQALADAKIFHYSNEGVCSWYDFAKAIFELSDIDCAVSPIETKDYPTPAARPHYSVMNKNKIKQAFEIEIPYWKDSLQNCINRL